MKHLILFLFACISIKTVVFAQEGPAVFFEKGPNNTIRFFYDVDYYLVAKDCEFKFIERVTGFDGSSNKFNGEFKDFGPNGRVLLAGNYSNGVKNGEFNAYYPDGTQKWKATFVNNRPSGEVQYFYPDGKPMLFVTAATQGIYINQFWNREGTQMVKDGEGKLDITLPITGFTEHGYTKYNSTGNVSNGLQQGLWYTYFVVDGKRQQKIPLMISAYENGQLGNREIDEVFEPMLIDFEALSFSPAESFPNGELLQSKNCSFDEHSGFNSFIAKKFKTYLENRKYSADTDLTDSLTYTIRVSKRGTAFAPTIVESSRELSQKDKAFFNGMINQVYYYLPSYLDNKPIDDRLTISVLIQTSGDLIHVPPVQIVREKGF